MWFWWFMFICDIITPVLMILAGYLMWRHPPQKINGFFGYRTSRSMQHMEAWKFAHHHCGKLWWRLGWITLFPSVFILILTYGKAMETISLIGLLLMSLQLVVLICSIFPTENALKKEFPNDKAENQGGSHDHQ